MTQPSNPLAGLTPEQRAAVELKLRQRRAEALSAGRIPRRANQEQRPLSFAQQRLWFVEQVNGAAGANHIAGAVRVQGRLALDALARSVSEIVRRHEVLRTGYWDDRGRPVARLAHFGPVQVGEQDVTGESAEERERTLRRLVAEEAQRPFDLGAGPLLRVTVFRVSAQDAVLLLVVHHIAADGWSMGVLAGELTVLYRSFLDGGSPPLPEPPIQYADFAEWQQEHASGSRVAEQLEWWRAQLRGMSALEVPADRPRPPVPTGAGARTRVELPPDLTSSLGALSQRHGVTLFMTLLAAFQTLLMRWTGQTDFGIGSPVAGRNWRETEPLIGLFVNTLVLRTNLAGDPSFADLLGRVRATVTGALGHQDVPFDRLVDELQVDRSMSQSALTPVVFALQNVPTAGLEFPDARLSVFEIDRSTSRFDLCLFVQTAAAGMAALVEYNTDLFDRPRIDRLLRGYVRLLEEVVEDPSQAIGALPVLEADERRRVLSDWNQTERPYPRDAVLPTLVARWAAETPDAVAVSCGEHRVSYATLDGRAEAMARGLAARGVVPGDAVGVCLERSVDLIAVLLAVLKAGGAYVPLDPGYPAARLAAMMASARVRLLVAHGGAGTGLHDSPVAVVDPVQLAVGAPSTAPFRADVRPEDLAYISFTSGSTGVPKGVEVPHRAVIRLLCGADYVRLGPDETLLQLAPVAFDASTLEIWGALLHGGRLAIYPDRVPDFDVLEQTLAAERVTTLWLTASLFNAVIDRAPLMLRGVRQLLIGGEALSREHVRRALDALPGTRIINGYGPTEGTTFTCCHPITRQDVENARSIPIGRPIANSRVFVLDQGLEPVPIGVPGELCIGGDGLARGYAGAPRLTAARFVPDPFGGRPGARLYRSGDRVRFQEDGTIEFLGRRDGQIKLRGYRIEIGEIEAALMRHPGVAAAVATVRPVQDRPTLVAYVVGREESPRDADLRGFLKGLLPDYMLPAIITPIAAVPLTPNGKVDRDALPAAVPARGAEDRDAAPRHEVDELVLETCRELLNTPDLGLHDNFFGLGGHSLLVTQLVSRLKRALQVDVSIRTVFESRTLGELSDTLLERVLDGADTDVSPAEG